VGGLLFWRGSDRSRTFVLLGWLATGAVAVSIGLRFFHHYFLYFAPAFALASGTTLRHLSSFAGSRVTPRRPVPTAAMTGIIALAPGLVHHRNFFLASSPDERSRIMYMACPFDISSEIAAHLASNTGPSETILIFGSEPQILFYAHRRSATR